MSNNAIPVKYVLFSHYGHLEKEDFKAFHQNDLPIAGLRGVSYLLDHIRGLKELLTSPGHEGILVLFYASGYERFLKDLAGAVQEGPVEGSPPDDGLNRLNFAQAVATYVRARLKDENLTERVRFLTSHDLEIILGRVNAISSAQFERFFIGPARGIRYDSPKVVEAILRLRLLGSGVPVLRLDHDVIFRGKNKAIGDLGLFKAVACSTRAYQLRLAQPSVSTFLFSASYNSRGLLYRNYDDESFEVWSRAFATRVYPALIAVPDKLSKISELKDESPNEKANKEAAWRDYVNENIDESIVRQFYGLTDVPGELEVDGVKGLASVGAHPLYAVISGALLCLSEGAILDLPPFSNLRFNVMWIDDHLKYSLHRAMDHFTSGESLDLEPGLGDARLDDVSVTKARPTVGNLRVYIFGIYLPTLLWGAIMDSWITSDAILKCRVANLDESEQQRYRETRRDGNKAPLPHAMLRALRTGSFSEGDKENLRNALLSTALTRIKFLRSQWAELRTDASISFASYWAQGLVEEAFGAEAFADCPDRLWEGISPGKPIDYEFDRLEDLSAPLALGVRDLVDDTVSYVEWALEWPKFVQIVRTIQQGSFVGDLSWTPE